MSDGELRIVAPRVEPATSPDQNTQAEMKAADKPSKRRSPPVNTPAVLLHYHREKTEIRLIDELDDARKEIDALVDVVRKLERNHATLRERHRAMKSQRSSSTVFAGVGATMLGITGMATLSESTKLIVFGIGATISSAAIFLDIRGCIETWMLPNDDGSK
jgi:hypothetical protein